jgi:hypothetical protein
LIAELFEEDNLSFEVLALSKIQRLVYGRSNTEKTQIDVYKLGNLLIQLNIPSGGTNLQHFNPKDYDLISMDFNYRVTSTIAMGIFMDSQPEDTVTNSTLKGIIQYTIVGSIMMVLIVGLIFLCSRHVKNTQIKLEVQNQIEMNVLKVTKGKL